LINLKITNEKYNVVFDKSEDNE